MTLAVCVRIAVGVNMASSKRMKNGEIAHLIELWRAEPALWDSTMSEYSNSDVRKQALTRIKDNMEGFDTGTYYVGLLVAYHST